MKGRYSERDGQMVSPRADSATKYCEYPWTKGLAGMDTSLELKSGLDDKSVRPGKVAGSGAELGVCLQRRSVRHGRRYALVRMFKPHLSNVNDVNVGGLVDVCCIAV